MNTRTCPFLGMQDDPNTAMDFPSSGNFCHHARPIKPVKGSYQERFCLTSDHVNCPLYQAANPIPMPPQIAAETPSRASGRRTIALLAIPILIAGVAALALAWNSFGKQLGTQTRLVPGTGGGQAPSLVTLPTDTPRALPSPTLSLLANAQPTNCPIPSGWVPYTVSPTDSLFRLSVIYGVTVENLQEVNCMGNKTVILPGQVIYVPFLPTRTPSSTPTRVPFVPTNSGGSKENPVPRPTSTPVPPTSMPQPTGTSVPPTATQPPLIPPTLIPIPPTLIPIPPTEAPPPTQEPKPTKEPKPTRPPKHGLIDPGFWSMV